MTSPFSWGKFARESSKTYHPLVSSDSYSSSEDGEAGLKTNSRPQYTSRRRGLHVFIIFLVVSIIALGTYTAKLYVRQSHTIGPKPITCLCGSSTAEAEAMGCKYDSLAACWLPDHCRDDELTAEFERAGTEPNGEWPYWADTNATKRISLKEVGLLADRPKSEAMFYSTFGWHKAHCAFYWRKEFRMRAKGLMLEDRYDRESHVAHCYPIFMARIPLDSVGAGFGVNLGGERQHGEEKEHTHTSHNGGKL